MRRWIVTVLFCFIAGCSSGSLPGGGTRSDDATLPRTDPQPIGSSLHLRTGDDGEQRHFLLITSDFGCVRRCSTIANVHAVARIMISAQPDIIAMDATANGLVNYTSTIGLLVPGSKFDALLSAGLQPFGMMVDTLRNHGITVLANVRMNDHHGPLAYWTTWEREHKEWSLGKDTGARDWKAIGALRQMDYAVGGVRTYRLSIVEEILEKFRVDGVQLDFGRTAPFLSEPKQENARHMTEYIRTVRQLLDITARLNKRPRLLLGVIVPWDLDFCMKEGLRVDQWAREGLIDYVSPGEWYYADWNIPLTRWHDVVRGTSCKLYPFTPGNVSPYQSFEYGEPSLLGGNRVLDPPQIRAIADNVIKQGVDGFAFYNFYTFDFGDYYPRLRTWTDPRTSAGMSRHYLYCRSLMYQPNERETFDLGIAFRRHTLRNIGERAESHFRFSTETKDSRTILRCAFRTPDEGDAIAVRLNGVLLTPDRVEGKTVRVNDSLGVGVKIWECATAGPLLKQGDNIIVWEVVERRTPAGEPIAVGEFELVVEPREHKVQQPE